MSKVPIHFEARLYVVSFFAILNIWQWTGMTCLALFTLFLQELQHFDLVLWCSRKTGFHGVRSGDCVWATQFLNSSHHHLGWRIGLNYLLLPWTTGIVLELVSSTCYSLYQLSLLIVTTHCHNLAHGMFCLYNFYVFLMSIEWNLKILTHSLNHLSHTHNYSAVKSRCFLCGHYLFFFLPYFDCLLKFLSSFYLRTLFPSLHLCLFH